MGEKLYEIHVLERKNFNPDFYVIDCHAGRQYARNEWPPNFMQLGCDYINEHSEFIVDKGYALEDVKSCFIDLLPYFNKLCIYVELTEEAESREIADYHNRILQISIGGDTTGDSVYPTFYHPEKK